MLKVFSVLFLKFEGLTFYSSKLTVLHILGRWYRGKLQMFLPESHILYFYTGYSVLIGLELSRYFRVAGHLGPRDQPVSASPARFLQVKAPCLAFFSVKSRNGMGKHFILSQ